MVCKTVKSSGVLCKKVSQYFGLSEYEARVYVSLIMKGVCGARKVSMRCGVPRTKVYATLKKLMERDLVFEVPLEPRRFAPTSPAVAFEQCLANFKEQASDRVVSLVESTEVVSLLEEEYEKTRSSVETHKEEVWIVQGQSEIVSKMKEMLCRAKKCVAVVTKENGFVWIYKTLGKLLDKLVENGVDVQIWTPINSHNGSLAHELNYICKVNHIDIGSPMLYLCVDYHTFFLTELNLNDVNVAPEKSSGVYCESTALCDLFSLLLPKLAQSRGQSCLVNK